jgi:hypothetical protein
MKRCMMLVKCTTFMQPVLCENAEGPFAIVRGNLHILRKDAAFLERMLLFSFLLETLSFSLWPNVGPVFIYLLFFACIYLRFVVSCSFLFLQSTYCAHVVWCALDEGIQE